MCVSQKQEALDIAKIKQENQAAGAAREAKEAQLPMQEWPSI
jgi:hypothetical protein